MYVFHLINENMFLAVIGNLYKLPNMIKSKKKLIFFALHRCTRDQTADNSSKDSLCHSAHTPKHS